MGFSSFATSLLVKSGQSNMLGSMLVGTGLNFTQAGLERSFQRACVGMRWRDGFFCTVRRSKDGSRIELEQVEALSVVETLARGMDLMVL